MNNIDDNMKKLSKILKNRSVAGFKNDLRNTLLRKANEINAVPVASQKPATKWHIPRFLKIAFAPAVAGALLVAVLFYSVSPGGVLFDSNLRLVDVAAAKDYYVLTAISEGPDGVDSDSGFLLESKGPIDADAATSAISISPDFDIEVYQESDTSVLIMPAADLEEGEVYQVSLDATLIPESPYPMEYSWAYQISDDFAIRGSYPADESAAVSIDTGIEVEFNSYGVTSDDFETYFDIDPYTDGQFEVQGKTGIFVPDGMSDGTIYTVTILSGLPLSGSDKVLAEDYIFQFETSGDSGDSGNLGFYRDLYEFSTSAIPSFTMSYYGWDEDEAEVIDVTVYQYSSGEDYMGNIELKDANIPSWARYASKYYSLSTDGLSTVLESSDTAIVDGYYSSNLLVLPETLDPGYYLVEVSKGDTKDQAFVQVSDMSAYVFAGQDSGLVWINDVSTGQPISGANVELVGTSYSYTTDADGTAEFDLPEVNNDEYDFIRVTYGSYETYYAFDYASEDSIGASDYWSFLTTERTTYHPTDRVYFWGYVEGRDSAIKGDLTLIVSDYAWSSDMEYIEKYGTVYLEESLSVSSAEPFESYVDLEKYPSGDYAIYLFDGENFVDSAQFSVEYFVKPAYDLSIETDETYVFPGDTVSIDINSTFFEGTPVSNLAVKYAPPVGDDEYVATNDQGNLALEYIAKSNNCSQTYCPFFESQYVNVYPQYEEEADISGEAKIKIIASTVGAPEVSADHESLHLQTMNVDIDKVRSYDGYMSVSTDEIYGSPAPNTQIDVDIKEYVADKKESGTYYDYIDKVSKTKYSYTYDYVDYDAFTIYSDENGEADRELTLNADSSYVVYYTVIDQYGNYYESSKWIYAGSADSMYYADFNYVEFDNMDEDSFSVGDSVDMDLAYSVPDTFDEENFSFLFLELQRGLRDYEVTSSPSYSVKFDEDMIPGITYKAIMFDGQYYLSTYPEQIYYDYEGNEKLDIEIDADAGEYSPGDMATLSFSVTDAATGKPASGALNVFMVDEAYYALYSDEISDPLSDLYAPLDPGSRYGYASHVYPAYDGGGKGGCFVAGTQIMMADGSMKNIEDIESGDTILTRRSEFDDELVTGEVAGTYEHYVSEYILINNMLGVTGEHVMLINGQWKLASDMTIGDVLVDADGHDVLVETIQYIDEPVYVYNFEVKDYHTYFANGIYVHNDKGSVRSDLKDTALFDVIDLGANGVGSVTFELPDNITSWRIVATAISDDRKAGFGTSNLDVSKPVFVVPVINDEYLTADTPTISVRAYGDYLSAGMQLSVGLESGSLGLSEEKSATAYEAAYFDLGTLTEGEHNITSYAEVDDEGDALMTTVTVLDSHLIAEQTWKGLLSETPGMQYGSSGRTEMSFMNYEVGVFYNELVSAATSSGDRADEVAAKAAAIKLLNDYFGEDFSPYEFDNFLYQDADGGIGLFPNDSTRLELSAKLASLDSGLWDTVGLNNYFHSILEGDDYTLLEKIQAIYGLAAVDDKMLIDLDYLTSSYELSDEEKIYSALAYMEIGSKAKAIDLYLSVNDEDSYPPLMAVLAAQIGSTDHYDFFSNIPDDVYDLSVVEKVMYAKALLYYGVDTEVSFKLNRELITLKNAEIHTESMLASEVANAEFSEVSGDIMVITKFYETMDIEIADTDSAISVSRFYTVVDGTKGSQTTAFSPGDLVEVHITVDVPTSMSGAYRVTDYLPSGLKITSQATNGKYYDDDIRTPYNIDGQSASFYVYKNDYEVETISFSYYARVINPGQFVSEPAVLQSMSDPSIINFSGGFSSITIE
ncbi:hypothetical protein AUK45_02410 [Candidatus Peregrinibacteria bacterium CG2_30_44_17]|nr:MAG: hypothetical protein AUK45_02410 [Candidatus Peregrinibacteria bacterium CG2_30_44_17]